MSTEINKEKDGLDLAWKSKNWFLRLLSIISLTATTAGVFLLIYVSISEYNGHLLWQIIYTFCGIGLGIYAVLSIYFDYKKKDKASAKIETLEEKLRENPKETYSAWELGKLNLQGYLDRNLNQVNYIFNLSVFVIIVGFGLIVFGVYKVFEDPQFIKPAILVSCAGLIINFIGASFLIIYKSTMNQAKNNIEVLERINAVGMSIQILETIDSSQIELKESTKAEIAKELLKIYSPKNISI